MQTQSKDAAAVLLLHFFSFLLIFAPEPAAASSSRQMAEIQLGQAGPRLLALHLTRTSLILNISSNGSDFAQEEEITLVAPPNHKLLGYVAYANLRVVWRNTTTEDGAVDYFAECRDYMEVGGERICHHVDPRDPHLYPPTLIGPRSLRGVERVIHLKIYLDGGRRRGRVALVLFTAYSECEDEESFDCKPEESFSCIPSSFKCDAQPNCLFPEAFAVDEQGCELPFSVSNISISFAKRGGKGGVGVAGKNKGSREQEPHQPLNQYFVPTALIFFMIWGLITLLRKGLSWIKKENLKDHS